jgi:N-acetylmuramoyl-L-alanine amidase
VAQIRLGRKPPDVLRIVLDLKTPVNAQVFALPPVAEFGHRLVVDLYPLTPLDPLMALLESEARKEARAEAAAPRAERPAPEARAAGSRAAPLTIAIDPGHGGEDPGATGPRGTREKDVVLAIARKLKAILDADRNTRVFMTRDDDYFVPLATRVQKARRVQADSVRVDPRRRLPRAAGARLVGVRLSEHGATSAAAKWLAQRENAAT